MSVSYKKLWHLLIDRDMKKGELCRKANISGTSLAKMAADKNVNTDTLARICIALDCGVDDILDITSDEPKEDNNNAQEEN
jgi:DNA-binding Xre family transcriptional regulator